MNRLINFCYRKIITASSPATWEQLVHEDSFAEFKMQAQRFNENNQHNTFAEILQNNAAAAQLHFLVSGAVSPYMKHLEGKIPDVHNTLGITFLTFKNFRFEIVQSHITDKSKHIIAISFYSEAVVWLDSIGDKMILSLQHETKDGSWATETCALQPHVSIFSLCYK